MFATYNVQVGLAGVSFVVDWLWRKSDVGTEGGRMLLFDVCIYEARRYKYLLKGTTAKPLSVNATIEGVAAPQRSWSADNCSGHSLVPKRCP